MKSYSIGFLFVIFISYSLESFADSFYYHNDIHSSYAACNTKKGDIGGVSCVHEDYQTGGYYYTYAGSFSGATFHKFIYLNNGCSTNGGYVGDNGICQSTPPESDNLCSATNNTSDCLCTDGLPRDSGQYTSCDRPSLKYCESLDTHIPTSQFCNIFPPDEYNCPSDTDFIDGQCVHKCGKNASWNGFEKRCEENGSNKQCPANYHAVNDVCVADACPPRFKKTADDKCVLDTDPKSDVVEETITHADGTKTKTVITTTTTNVNSNKTTVTTTTTVTNYDADGNVTSVDSSQSEKETEESQDDKSSVSGDGTCNQVPICEGDAIACANLDQNWKAACLEHDDKVEISLDCTQQFQCEGNVLECAALKINHANRCEFTENKAKDFFASGKFKSEFDASSEIGSDGVLTSLIPESIDVKQSMNFDQIFSYTQGNQGHCPDKVAITLSTGSMLFDYDPICQGAVIWKPFFLFFVTWFCFKLISNALTGTRR